MTHKPIRMLMVDDEPLDLEVMTHLIRWKDHGISIAGTACNAHEAMALINDHLDLELLVSDIQMPIVDGIALYEEALTFIPHLKAIFISGHDEFHYAQRAIRLQASGYVLKPVDESELEEVLARVCGNVLQNRAAMLEEQPPRRGEDDISARAIEFIQANIGQGVTLQTVASHLHYSSGYLGTTFKQQTGVSMMAYILNARLEHAASALRNTDVGVAELATRLGYASTSYFIQVFRTKYRMTPGDYRRAALCG